MREINHLQYFLDLYYDWYKSYNNYIIELYIIWKIVENYKAIKDSLLKERPNGIKGNFILSSYLSSTMGISYRLKSTK